MPLERLYNCDLCGSDQILTIDPDANVDMCVTCGYLFDNPRPSMADIEIYYSTVGKYDSWLEELEGRDLLWKRRLSKVTRHVREGRLLDVGAGIGQFLFQARERFEVTGTEVSDEAVQIAREHFGVTLKKNVIESSVEFPRASYDVITLFHVLEHVPFPGSTIDRCRELLKDGAFLFIAVPNDRFAFWRHGGLIRYCVKKVLGFVGVVKYRKLVRFEKIVLDPEIQTEIHLSHFTSSTPAAFLRKSGFDIVSNSLDPYYSVTGLARVREGIRFIFYRMINRVFSINLYETIWIVARRRTRGRSPMITASHRSRTNVGSGKTSNGEDQET